MSDKDMLDEIKTELRKYVDNLERLTVLYLGGSEQILGIVKDPIQDSNAWVEVYNPVRIVRMVRQVDGGMVITYLVSPFDMLDGPGWANVKPNVYWGVAGQSERVQIGVLGMYLEFLEKERLKSAKEAGLILPDPAGVRKSPFKKGL